MTPEQQVYLRLACLKLAVATAVTTADRSEQRVVEITTSYYNAVVEPPLPVVPSKKDKSKTPDPLS